MAKKWNPGKEMIKMVFDGNSIFDAKMTTNFARQRLKDLVHEQDFSPYGNGHDGKYTLIVYCTGHGSREGLLFADGVLGYQALFDALLEGIPGLL